MLIYQSLADRNTRGGIRTHIYGHLEPAPLPVGVLSHCGSGRLRPCDFWFFRPALLPTELPSLSTSDRSRTCNLRDLNPAPLPIGLRSHSTPLGSRTRNPRILSPVPLPIGVEAHKGGCGDRTRAALRTSADSRVATRCLTNSANPPCEEGRGLEPLSHYDLPVFKTGSSSSRMPSISNFQRTHGSPGDRTQATRKRGLTLSKRVPYHSARLPVCKGSLD